MITVMLIMAVLAAVAAPRLIQIDSQDRATAEQLRSTLRYAQRIAATRNRNVCVTVAAKSVVFRIATTMGTCSVAPLALLIPLNELIPPLPATSPLSYSPVGSFSFTPNGALGAYSGLPIAARAISVMRSGSAFATLTIQPDNGYVLATNF